ncbi:MAG TPA: response regulator [Blastocatellia bacterium]|nr:response regulator [Blastocatellia bacterium]
MRKNLRILIIDEDATMGELLGTALSRRGFRVAFAVDGLDAARRCESFQPDLVMLEELTPTTNVFGLYQLIKDSASPPKTITFSNKDLAEIEREIGPGGQKPYLVC